MKAVFEPMLRYSFLIAILAAFALAGAACVPAQTVQDDHATASEHSHAEGEADEHSHDEGDGQSGEQGSTVIGEEEVEIDHHGNPVFDEEERVYEQVVQEGVSVEFTVENFLGVGGRGGELAPRIVEGEHAVLQFHLTDADSSAPLAGLRPAVWLDLGGEDTSDEACQARVQGYLGGTLDARPMVDLNSYFILGMNKDNTLSVIDPMVDVAGMTNLFAVILLQGTPHDWAMSADHLKLFVTLPELGKVAVVDLDSLQVVANIDVNGRPARVAVQPDGRYAWAGIESQSGSESGVAVIDAADQSLAAQIPTGAGAHALAFSPDSRYAYVTSSGGNTLSVIDTRTLERVKALQVGADPAAVAVSATTGTVYVAERGSGAISIIDPKLLVATSQLQADPGLAAVAVSADGRWGIAANPDAQKVYVIETDGQRITHVVPVKGAPDQITFTDTAAYIRSSSTPAVFVIPLAEIDPQGNVSVLTVPVGDLPPDASQTASAAQAVFPTPNGDAVLVANPADDKIYYYVEGSQSALGGYQGHTLVPRAVQVVDRSLKERSPGVYTGGIRIPRSGDFVVAFLLDHPRLVHCFKFTAKPNPELNDAANALQLDLKFLTTEQPTAGETFNLRIELTNADTGEPVEGVNDLLGLARVLAGNWNQRATAADLGKGVYEIQFTFPNPGKYNLFFVVPSLGVNFDQLPQRTLQVTGK